MHQITNLQSGYQAKIPFKAALIAHAPGRINIIGEHTDYNGGFVLPAAIAEAVSIAVRKNEDEDQCILHALDLNETYEFKLSELAPKTDGGWPNYLMGVVQKVRILLLYQRQWTSIFTSSLSFLIVVLNVMGQIQRRERRI